LYVSLCRSRITTLETSRRSLPDARPISRRVRAARVEVRLLGELHLRVLQRQRAVDLVGRDIHKPLRPARRPAPRIQQHLRPARRSEEHTSELQSRENLVCRLLLERKKMT